MPRGRKKNANAVKENSECCSGWRHNKIISMGLILILLGFAVRLGWGIADLLLLVGAIFIVKGLIISMMKK